VQHLACPADIQLELLAAFVCKADEIALNFDHWRSTTVSNYRNELTSEQISSLEALDGELAEISRTGAEVWTEAAVREFQQWRKLRERAAISLSLFGWRLEAPPSYVKEYVEGKRR
jgi:hypothetical protein